MVKLIVIACVAENNVIGKDGDIPWHIKEDFKHFQNLTMGHPCIMGDKTYDSLPDSTRPLPGRENIVLTFDKKYSAPGAKVFYSWESAIESLKDSEKAFVCGGASIYRIGLKHADTLEITRIHKAFEGDTFFPEIDINFKLIKEIQEKGTNLKTGEELNFSFLTYKRTKGE